MIHATPRTFVGAAEVVRPVRRVQFNGKGFWLLFVAEALLVASVLLMLLRALPAVAPAAAAPDYGIVRNAIFERANGAVLDPLIEVTPGVVAPASNVRGMELRGVTYYYYFEGQQNFDPLSRGRIASERVHVVLRDGGGEHPLVIYTITR